MTWEPRLFINSDRAPTISVRLTLSLTAFTPLTRQSRKEELRRKKVRKRHAVNSERFFKMAIKCTVALKELSANVINPRVNKMIEILVILV